MGYIFTPYALIFSSIYLWSMHTVVNVEAQSFQVVPRDTCVPCGGSAVLNCSTTAPIHLGGGRIVNGAGGQLWRIQNPDGTVTSLSSSMPSMVPAGYEFIANQYTGLRLLDTNSTWNGTTFQCIAFNPTDAREQNNSAAAVTLEVGSPPQPFSCQCQCPDVHCSGTSDQCTITWDRLRTVSCSSLQFSVSLTLPNGTSVYNENFDQGITSTPTVPLDQDTVYSVAITAGSVCGSTTCSANCSTASIDIPAVPNSCSISLSYNQPSKRLLFINSTWDAVPACLGPTRDITQYQIRFQSGPVVATENVNIPTCTAGRCSHTFEPPSNPPSSYDSVSVAAENVVGVGAARNCTTQTISTTNNLLTGRTLDVHSRSDVTIVCIFLSGFTGSAHCTVHYGTDPTYMNLPYSAESTENGTAGDAVSVVLRERLKSSTVYYYTVSAVSGDVTVRVQGNFTTPQYSCSLTDLITTDGVTRCTDRGFANTLPVSSGVVCYNRTTAGSEAVYICDEGFNQDGAATRVCQSDGVWDGSKPQCLRYMGGQNVTECGVTQFWSAVGIAVATTAVVMFIAGTLAGALLFFCISKHRSQGLKPESSSHEQQQVALSSLQQQKAVSSPYLLKQMGPEYEDVIKLRQNAVYGITLTHTK